MSTWLLRRTPSWVLSRWIAIRSLFKKNGPGFFVVGKMMLPGRWLSAVEREIKKNLLSEAARDMLTALPDGSVEILGHPFYALQDNYWGVLFSFWEIIDEDQYGAKGILKKDSVVVDAGGSAGLFAVLAATLAPEGKIYVFEPNPISFKVLGRNTKPYPNIICMPFALGDRSGKSKMRSVDYGHGNAAIVDSPFLQGKEDFGGELEIAVTTLDDFSRKHLLSRLDFLKIDTEGYERFVLRGGAETIKKLKPAIGMSAYHNPDDKEVLPQIIRSMNPEYVIDLHKEHGEEDFRCYVPIKSAGERA